jgi:hypothetical protein
MKPETIQLKGVEVEIQFVEDHGDQHVGWATHTVASADLEEGTANGPSDGETFELGGKTYRLGQHDYSTDQPGSEDDKDCVCTAMVYLVED